MQWDDITLSRFKNLWSLRHDGILWNLQTPSWRFRCSVRYWIFLQEYDTHQAKLTAKNAAHVTVREKEQELKRWYTFEAVLEAFLAAERQIVSLIRPESRCHSLHLLSKVISARHGPSTFQRQGNLQSLGFSKPFWYRLPRSWTFSETVIRNIQQLSIWGPKKFWNSIINLN